jgi:hypothetical protein
MHRRRRYPQRIALSTAILVLLATDPALLPAQAWLPPKGDGSITFAVQTIFFDGHYDDAGHKLGLGQSRATSLLLGVSYSFTDRFTVDLQLPYVFTKYTGDPAIVIAPLDDGNLHSTFQDFHIDLHYTLLHNSHRSGLQSLAITPFLSITQPSHSYEYHGESAFGGLLRQYALGISAGRLLTPVFHRAYVQGQYSYAFVPRTEGFSLNHSNIDLELGYFLPRSLSVWGVGSWLRTHGGITAQQFIKDPKLFQEHDRLLRGTYWHIGFGTSYPITRSFDVNFTYVTYLAGRTTHYGRAFTVGTTWNFSTRRFSPSASDNLVVNHNPPLYNAARSVGP